MMSVQCRSVITMMSLVLLLLGVQVGAQTDMVPIHEQDFESTPVGEIPSGWELIEFPGAPDKPYVIEAPKDLGREGNVLYIGRTSDTPNTTGLAVYSFDPVEQRLQVGFKMWQTTRQRSLRVTIGGGGRAVADIHGSPKSASIFLMMNNGTIFVLKDADKNEWIEVGEFSAQKWHTIMLDIDIQAQTFNFHLDGSARPQNAEPLPFYAASADLSTIAFGYQQAWVGANNTAPAYVDDLLLWGK